MLIYAATTNQGRSYKMKFAWVKLFLLLPMVTAQDEGMREQPNSISRLKRLVKGSQTKRLLDAHQCNEMCGLDHTQWTCSWGCDTFGEIECDSKVTSVNLQTGERTEYRCCRCGCFPATARVSLENGKSVAMSELQIGDKVQTVLNGNVNYSKVRAFLQNQQKVLGKYLAITTCSNKTITLSENHLIYTRGSVYDRFIPRYADKVSIGEEVLIGENSKLMAVKVKEVFNFPMQGAFVPLTDEGNIVVDGILASCYASFDHDLAHFAMTPMKWFSGLVEWVFGEDNGI